MLLPGTFLPERLFIAPSNYWLFTKMNTLFLLGRWSSAPCQKWAVKVRSKELSSIMTPSSPSANVTNSLWLAFLLCLNLASSIFLHPALPDNQYPLIGTVIWDDVQPSCLECSTLWLIAFKGIYPHRLHRGWEVVMIFPRPRNLSLIINTTCHSENYVPPYW